MDVSNLMNDNGRVQTLEIDYALSYGDFVLVKSSVISMLICCQHDSSMHFEVGFQTRVPSVNPGFRVWERSNRVSGSGLEVTYLRLLQIGGVSGVR